MLSALGREVLSEQLKDLLVELSMTRDALAAEIDGFAENDRDALLRFGEKVSAFRPVVRDVTTMALQYFVAQSERVREMERLAYDEVSVILPVSIPPLEKLLADAKSEHDLYIDATYAGDDVERRVHGVRDAWASRLADSVRSGRLPEGVPLRVARL